MRRDNALRDAAERWSEVALAEDWIKGWVEGAIFPCEMVFFLASCDVHRIDHIIESGRQDGYSTMILGRYAERTGTPTVSIDLEKDQARAEACRRRLAGAPLDLQVGNAFERLPRLLQAARHHRSAILLDGPKGWSGLALGLGAAAFPSLSLVAIHNLGAGLPDRTYLEDRAKRPMFYESLIGDEDGAWSRLRAEERRFGRAVGAVRPLDSSTLAVLPIDEPERNAFARTTARPFGIYQPRLLAAMWQLGLFAMTPRLFKLSFRLFGH